MQSFDTAPTLNISRTTSFVPEHLEITARICTAQLSVAGETFSIRLDTTAIAALCFNNSCLPSAREHRLANRQNASSLILFPGPLNSSSISSKIAPDSMIFSLPAKITSPSLNLLTTNRTMDFATPASSIHFRFFSSSASSSNWFKDFMNVLGLFKSRISRWTRDLVRGDLGVGRRSIPLWELAMHQDWMRRRSVWLGVNSPAAASRAAKGCFVTGQLGSSAAANNHCVMLSRSYVMPVTTVTGSFMI
nr:hypothetical protein PanWU01x14_220340 [Ipomoea batatas]